MIVQLHYLHTSKFLVILLLQKQFKKNTNKVITISKKIHKMK